MSNDVQVQSPAVVEQGIVANGKADHEAAENLGGVSALKDSRFTDPPTQVYNPEQQHDVVRTIITCSFIFIFGLTILGSFVIVILREVTK